MRRLTSHFTLRQNWMGCRISVNECYLVTFQGWLFLRKIHWLQWLSQTSVVQIKLIKHCLWPHKRWASTLPLCYEIIRINTKRNAASNLYCEFIIRKLWKDYSRKISWQKIFFNKVPVTTELLGSSRRIYLRNLLVTNLPGNGDRDYIDW